MMDRHVGSVGISVLPPSLQRWNDTAPVRGNRMSNFFLSETGRPTHRYCKYHNHCGATIRYKCGQVQMLLDVVAKHVHDSYNRHAMSHALLSGCPSEDLKTSMWQNFLTNHSHTPKHTVPCNRKRFGGDGDGGKELCTTATSLGTDGCQVISVGSNGEASFEKAVHQFAPSCTISTWDGTLDQNGPRSANHLPSFIRFVPMNFNASSYEKFNRSTPVSVLKVDCPGCDMDALVPWVDNICTEQISFELEGSAGQPPANHPFTGPLFARLSREFFFVYAEPNFNPLELMYEMVWQRRKPC